VLGDAQQINIQLACIFVRLFFCKNSCVVRLYAYFCASKANKNPAQFGRLFISPPLMKSISDDGLKAHA